MHTEYNPLFNSIPKSINAKSALNDSESMTELVNRDCKMTDSISVGVLTETCTFGADFYLCAGSVYLLCETA